MLKDIFLYGELANKYEKHLKLNVSSVVDVFKAMEALYPGFNDYIRDKKIKVIKGDKLNTGIPLTIDEATIKFSKDAFHIALAIKGEEMATIMFCLTVISMALQVYIAMTTQVPSLDYGNREKAEERPSFLFNGSINTIEQGGPVPLVYGQYLVGSTIVGASIRNEEIAN